VAGVGYLGEDQAALHDHLLRIGKLFPKVDCLAGIHATPTSICKGCEREMWRLVYLHGHGRVTSGNGPWGADNPWANAITFSDGSRLPPAGTEGAEFLLTARRLFVARL